VAVPRSQLMWCSPGRYWQRGRPLSYIVRLHMTRRRKIVTWATLILLVPATFYAGASVIFYAWLNAAEPERWPEERAALWAYSALGLAILFMGVFIWCTVVLFRDAKRRKDEPSAI
jgi:uncharacterized BrkB/YihY/UPF0761 family membrane protein